MTDPTDPADPTDPHGPRHPAEDDGDAAEDGFWSGDETSQTEAQKAETRREGGTDDASQRSPDTGPPDA